MTIFKQHKKFRLSAWTKYVNHGLNIKSYLDTIFPKELIKLIYNYDIFLIKGDINLAMKYLASKDITDITVIDFLGERPCFEKMLLCEENKIIVICNLHSNERIKHYKILLQAYSDISKKNITYHILKNDDNNFYNTIYWELIEYTWKINKCIIWYWSEFELYFWLPTKIVRNNYFSYRYYEKLNIIFIWHVFWWNSYLIVSILKKIWVEKFAYIWNCGWLGKLKIWDIISPKTIIKYNYLNKIKKKDFPTHISVPSPIIETNRFLKKIKTLWILTIDVEYADLYNFIWKTNFYSYLIVSDLPWKENKNNARISNMVRFRKWLLKVVQKVINEFIFK